MKLSKEVVNSLPAKKQVHWMFPKDYGLNDTDNESASDEETWFDSFSSDSDPEAEFYQPETGQTSLNYFFVEYYRSATEQGMDRKIGFLCPDDWASELRLYSLEVDDF